MSALIEKLAPMMLAGAVPLASLGVIVGVMRLARWHGDRKVVAATTERERSYRPPSQPANAVVVAPSPWPPVLRVAPFAAIWLVTGYERRIALGLALTVFAVIALTAKRAYGTWRSRRNARLQLKWDRWLESADSCKVGTREWTE